MPPLILNLIFFYQIMVASENMLEMGISGLSSRTRDEFEDKLLAYYKSHIEEERDHARWLANDLRDNGIEPNDYGLIRAAVAMAGSQYYLMQHTHEVSLLGYMFVLESNPVSLTQVEKWEEEFGTSLLRTLRYHSEHDVEHSVDLRKILNELPIKFNALVNWNIDSTRKYLEEATRLINSGEIKMSGESIVISTQYSEAMQ